MSSYSVDKLVSIAASGTANVTIPVAQYVQEIAIKVDASYSTVSATASGVSASFQVSADGSTFVNSNASSIQAGSGSSSANVISEAEQIIRTQNDPFRQDGGPLESIKVNLTNLDGSNAALVAVSHSAKQYNF